MDGCKGMPLKEGYAKPCPVRVDCLRYQTHLDVSASRTVPNGYHAYQGPYDFDDDECGKLVER